MSLENDKTQEKGMNMRKSKKEKKKKIIACVFLAGFIVAGYLFARATSSKDPANL